MANRATSPDQSDVWLRECGNSQLDDRDWTVIARLIRAKCLLGFDYSNLSVLPNAQI